MVKVGAQMQTPAFFWHFMLHSGWCGHTGRSRQEQQATPGQAECMRGAAACGLWCILMHGSCTPCSTGQGAPLASDPLPSLVATPVAPQVLRDTSVTSTYAYPFNTTASCPLAGVFRAAAPTGLAIYDSTQVSRTVLVPRRHLTTAPMQGRGPRVPGGAVPCHASARSFQLRVTPLCPHQPTHPNVGPPAVAPLPAPSTLSTRRHLPFTLCPSVRSGRLCFGATAAARRWAFRARCPPWWRATACFRSTAAATRSDSRWGAAQRSAGRGWLHAYVQLQLEAVEVVLA